MFPHGVAKGGLSGIRKGVKMRESLLEVLRCPACRSSLKIATQDFVDGEIRSGSLVCDGADAHEWPVDDGIVRTATEFGRDTVKSEQDYSRDTFKGDPRLIDPEHVAHYPDTLPVLWPHTYWFGPDFRDMLTYLNFSSSSWTLDIGTGACWTTRLLAEKGGHVIALDVIETPFNGLRTADILFKAHNVYFDRVLESMTKLPFRDESFDHIVFNASFHHSPDEKSTLSECYRVLKPNGTLVLLSEVTSPLSPLVKKLLRGHVSHSVEEGSSHHDISCGEFSRLMSGTKFKARAVLPAHTKAKLRSLLKSPLGDLAIRIAGTSQALTKLLSTGFILLTK
jgi:SAM-dependent methyltransferase/uncharacterized protein YbaR (Trm112 family)